MTATKPTQIRNSVRAGTAGLTSISRLLRLVLLAGALAYIGVFLVTAVFRLGYPYPLESTEPASLSEVEQI
ncbi:MAG: hypothetical protein M3069_05385, partial [Chloroflexota bacterium]|nr:hypothetical protein [Chloroflexota bacterium]